MIDLVSRLRKYQQIETALGEKIERLTRERDETIDAMGDAAPWVEECDRLREVIQRDRDEWRFERAEKLRLRAALENTADTFRDLRKGLILLQRPVLAAACEVAENASREALRGGTHGL